ncbi:MAG: AAA family ATPase [Porticoccus sp.]
MKYRESNTDKSLRKWFAKDNSRALLKTILLREGRLRGLSKFRLDLKYPITAISGKNGSGKSTLLAMACCAYHNKKSGFRLPNRRTSYYTFADFFVQHAEDVPPEGIEMMFAISYDKWRKSEQAPDGIGTLFQARKKKKGGRWNDYDARVARDVVFLGIERIVPHNEKSQSKSYSRAFTSSADEGWEDKVREAVGKILGKKYEEFKYVSHSKYRLPIVKVNGKKYSGFNMGAGENALFEVLSVMHSIASGGLIVIDEIELGLHSEAQKKFIMHLKELCKERKIQIICTTHSRDIFSELPDDGRVFIDNINGNSIVSTAVSSDYAFSKLAAENSNELHLLVEDRTAKAILKANLPSSIRSRVSVEVIGSASALSRQLASNYLRENKAPIFTIFDGDQRAKENDNIGHACAMAEPENDEEFKEWAGSNISYLPGETWPESWLIQKCAETIDEISVFFGIDSDEMVEVIESGLEAGKHKEFYQIGKLTGLDEVDALNRFCMCCALNHKDEFDDLVWFIEEQIEG